MSHKLKIEAIDWLVAHPEVLDEYDGTKESRDATANAMKAAGVLRAATANHFIRIDQYIEVARASR